MIEVATMPFVQVRGSKGDRRVKVAHKKAAGILMGAIGGEKDFQNGGELAMDRDLAAGSIDAASINLSPQVTQRQRQRPTLESSDVFLYGGCIGPGGNGGGGCVRRSGVEITMGYGERGFLAKVTLASARIPKKTAHSCAPKNEPCQKEL